MCRNVYLDILTEPEIGISGKDLSFAEQITIENTSKSGEWNLYDAT